LVNSSLSKKNKEEKNPLSFVVVMMTSKKMMKEMPKRDETVISDDPRIGIGIYASLTRWVQAESRI
jgi:hypothetical protein